VPQGGVRWLHRRTATRLCPIFAVLVCAQAACRACRVAPGAWLEPGQTHPVSRFGARRRPGVSPLCGRWATQHAVAETLGLKHFDEDDLYTALDRLAEEQEHIEDALYRRAVRRRGSAPTWSV